MSVPGAGHIRQNMRSNQFLYRIVLVLVCTISLLASSAEAQPVRSPELNLQYHRAEVAWKSGGSVLEAKARVDRVLAVLPDDVDALKLRAQVLLGLNKPDEAVRDARKATTLRVADGEAHLILAEAALAAGLRDQALVALGHASDRVLHDAGSHVRMSWIASNLGNEAWAEAFARTALALDPREPAAYMQLARVFAEGRRMDQAAEVLARGLRRAVLGTDSVARDSTLAPLLQHPTIMDTLR